MNGGKTYKNERYLIKILESLSSINKYEAPIIIRAFLKTLKYFIDNAIEFSIHDVFDFKKYHKKECKCYVVYKDEMQIIPEHYLMKFSISKKLKDYLNERNEFKNVRHRENLPDGIRRTKDLF